MCNDPFGEATPLPCCLESEGAVIVAALTQRGDLDKAVGELQPEDFMDPEWQRIWTGILELNEAKVPVDIPAIKDWLNRKGLVRTIDPERMQRTLMVSPYVTDIEKHVHQVQLFARLRRVLSTCQRIAAEAYGAPDDIDAFIARAEADMYRVAAATGSTRVIHHLSDCVRDLFQRMQYECQDGSVFARTGLTKLDEMIGGLRPGKFVVIPARPSMGKTALVLNIGTHVASLEMIPRLAVHVISLESQRDEVTSRIIADKSEVDIEKISQSKIHDEDWPNLAVGAQTAFKLPMTIDDRRGLTLGQIRSSIRRAQAELRKVENGVVVQKLGVVLVDYIQLIQNPIRGGTRDQEVGAVAQGLHDLAGEFNVCIVALAQLSRACEARSDKRPVMSDIRESGAIEQAADVIVALYRDEYYNKESPDKGIAEAIVLKSKNTRTGTVRIAFQPQWMRFRNLENEETEWTDGNR